MVLTKSSMGRSKKLFVNVEVKGINDTILKMQRQGKMIGNKTELSLLRSGNWVQQEVQESIIGNRAEPTSVDTGDFANSIELDITQLTNKKERAIAIFTPLDYPKFLEFGTVNIRPRRHFQNTIARSRKKVINDLKAALGVKFHIGIT